MLVPRQPAPGWARRPAERRELVPRLQVDRPPRPRRPPAAGAVGRGRLAGVRRRRPDGRSLEEAGRRQGTADRAAGHERRLRRAAAVAAVAVEPQPRAGGVVPGGAAGMAPPRGAAGERHRPARENTLTQKLWDDAGVFEVRLDTTGMADGQRAGRHVHQRQRVRLGGRRDARGQATHRVGAGRGAGADRGRRGPAGSLLGERRAPRVQPRRPGLHRHRRRRSPSPSATGRARGSASSTTDGGGTSTSTPCATATDPSRSVRSPVAAPTRLSPGSAAGGHGTRRPPRSRNRPARRPGPSGSRRTSRGPARGRG